MDRKFFTSQFNFQEKLSWLKSRETNHKAKHLIFQKRKAKAAAEILKTIRNVLRKRAVKAVPTATAVAANRKVASIVKT